MPCDEPSYPPQSQARENILTNMVQPTKNEPVSSESVAPQPGTTGKNVTGADTGNAVVVSRTKFVGKMLRTVCNFMGLFVNTLNIAVLGPSLLDLESITGSTTSQMSAVFMIRGALFIVSSLCMGPLVDRVNVYLLMGIALIANAVLYCSVPWCTTFTSILIVLSLPELFNGASTLGAPLAILELWKENSGPAMQMTNLLAVVGFLMGPLIVQPFLSHELPAEPTSNNSNITTSYSMTSFGRQLNVTGNVSNPDVTTATPSMSESYVYISYVIVGLCSLLGGIGMFIFYFIDIRCCRSPTTSDSTSSNVSDKVSTIDGNLTFQENCSIGNDGACSNCDTFSSPNILADNSYTLDPYVEQQANTNPVTEELARVEFNTVSTTDKTRLLIKVSILFAFLNIFYAGIEIGYAGLLTTFAVKFLGWSKEEGTTVTALIQLANIVATGAAVFLCRCVKPQVFLICSMIAVITSMLLLSALVQSFSVILWPCTALLGAGYGTIIPSSYLWVGSFMEIDGRFSSAYWTGYSVGYSAIPALTGYLFNDVHPMSFPYVMLSCSVCMAATFVCLMIVVRFRPVPNKSEIEIQPDIVLTSVSKRVQPHLSQTNSAYCHE